jgi:hypothetical protein
MEYIREVRKQYNVGAWRFAVLALNVAWTDTYLALLGHGDLETFPFLHTCISLDEVTRLEYVSETEKLD